MKYLIVTMLFFGLRFSYSQSDTTRGRGDIVAARIADKLADSLILTGTQRDRIYRINLALHTQKMAARRSYTGRDAIRNAIQQIENSRDSLYRMVLPEDKYLVYRQKKFKVVSAQ
jgi:hypothetical protein